MAVTRSTKMIAMASPSATASRNPAAAERGDPGDDSDAEDIEVLATRRERSAHRRNRRPEKFDRVQQQRRFGLYEGRDDHGFAPHNDSGPKSEKAAHLRAAFKNF